ncbi:glycosyltransferase family 39 protein [bacterium]|nr:glycosyltransferase family 39 protein [candidate division CSSED10-310 bacterium]
MNTAAISRIRTLTLLTLILVAAAIIRFASLHDIPGLEHDEALICAGARNISENHVYPQTGDKVYEGPLLEYLIALAMKIGGSSDFSARCVLALCGVLAVLGVYFAGKNLGDPMIGLFSSSLMVFSAWHLAASRVIYACNLSQLFIPLWIVSFLLFLKKGRYRFVLLAGIMLGLAANGRFTAAFLLVPTGLAIWIVRRKSGFTGTILLLIAFIIPVSSLLLYNLENGWPIMSILTGSGQSHLLRDPHQMIPRWTGYLVTLVHALNGSKFWLDFDIQYSIPFLSPFILLLIGIVFSCARRDSDDQSRTWLIGILLFMIVLIPIFTKTTMTSSSHIDYHPHYLDLVMPLVIVLAGLGIYWIWSWKKYLGLVVWVLTILSQLYVLIWVILPDIKTKGLPGRWGGHAGRAAMCIRNNFDPLRSIIVVPWQFGAGYPQLAFLLDEYQVNPVLDRYYGDVEENSDALSKLVIFCSPIHKLPSPPWSPVGCKGDIEQRSQLFYVRSPGYLIEGRWIMSQEETYQLRSDDAASITGKWADLILSGHHGDIRLEVESRVDLKGNHPLFQSESIRVTPRHRKIVKLLETTVLAHQLKAVNRDDREDPWLLTWWNESSEGTSQLVEIRRGDAVIDGQWYGTSIFY